MVIWPKCQVFPLAVAAGFKASIAALRHFELIWNDWAIKMRPSILLLLLLLLLLLFVLLWLLFTCCCCCCCCFFVMIIIYNHWSHPAYWERFVSMLESPTWESRFSLEDKCQNGSGHISVSEDEVRRTACTGLQAGGEVCLSSPACPAGWLSVGLSSDSQPAHTHGLHTYSVNTACTPPLNFHRVIFTGGLSVYLLVVPGRTLKLQWHCK